MKNYKKLGTCVILAIICLVVFCSGCTSGEPQKVANNTNTPPAIVGSNTHYNILVCPNINCPLHNVTGDVSYGHGTEKRPIDEIPIIKSDGHYPETVGYRCLCHNCGATWNEKA